jgi:hypothetical protein
MILKYHKTLTPEKWKAYSFSRQILMIANELNRAGNWIVKNDYAEVKRCYERALELLWITVEALENKRKLRELLRFRDLVAFFYLTPPDISLENDKIINVLITLDADSYRLLNHRHAQLQ